MSRVQTVLALGKDQASLSGPSNVRSGLTQNPAMLSSCRFKQQCMYRSEIIYNNLYKDRPGRARVCTYKITSIASLCVHSLIQSNVYMHAAPQLHCFCPASSCDPCCRSLWLQLLMIIDGLPCPWLSASVAPGMVAS